jgi:hypothetical protein
MLAYEHETDTWSDDELGFASPDSSQSHGELIDPDSNPTPPNDQSTDPHSNPTPLNDESSDPWRILCGMEAVEAMYEAYNFYKSMYSISPPKIKTQQFTKDECRQIIENLGLEEKHQTQSYLRSSARYHNQQLKELIAKKRRFYMTEVHWVAYDVATNKFRNQGIRKKDRQKN